MALTRRGLLAASATAVVGVAIGVPLAERSHVPLAAAPNTPLWQRARFGAWSATGGGVVADHAVLERAMGVRMPLVSFYQSWPDPWPRDIADGILALDRNRPYDIMVAWLPQTINFTNILRGDMDDFLRKYFNAAKHYPGRVLMRFCHEMNGDWYVWSIATKESHVASTKVWRKVWQRVVTVANECGAHNVQFVFCPNAGDAGTVPAEEYWPGKDYVDVIGVDGYNWGWNAKGEPYATPEQVIAPMYARLTALHDSAEFMVGEISSALHKNKAAWFQALYTTTAFPRLSAVCFFNEKKEQDWRLNSDSATLAVNRRYLAQAPA